MPLSKQTGKIEKSIIEHDKLITAIRLKMNDEALFSESSDRFNIDCYVK